MYDQLQQVAQTDSAMSPATIPTARCGASRFVVRLSEALLRIEQGLVTTLMGLLMALILVNVASRYAGHSIFWIDEAAVFAVVWLTFIGASAMTRLRLDFAVGLLTEHLGPRGLRIAKVAATSMSLAFAGGLVVMCWLWLDPAGFAQAGFDGKRFAESSFNFIYTERSQALGWSNWVMYLVIPLYAITSFVHTGANLVEDLGWQPLPGPRLGNSAGNPIGAEG